MQLDSESLFVPQACSCIYLWCNEYNLIINPSVTENSLPFLKLVAMIYWLSKPWGLTWVGKINPVSWNLHLLKLRAAAKRMRRTSSRDAGRRELCFSHGHLQLSSKSCVGLNDGRNAGVTSFHYFCPKLPHPHLTVYQWDVVLTHGKWNESWT